MQEKQNKKNRDYRRGGRYRLFLKTEEVRIQSRKSKISKTEKLRFLNQKMENLPYSQKKEE
jgi:hypothetical protein